ncbi:MAG: 1-acyl-sn-glycerol-3-phosphate acyltransferase [Pseudomonadota bacterium]|nr:1-acyl-sn-glycerol-3-phosphate acyltransferase [Pseudomonadota bacterium]
MMLKLRAFWFYCGLCITIVIFACLSFLILPLPYPRRYQLMSGWSYFVSWWLQKTCALTHIVYGQKHIPKGPMIVFSKHQSSWETIVFIQIFPVQTWILKKELLWLPLFGWALATLKPVAISRRHIRQSLRQIVEKGSHHLNQGRSVIIFPEGTRVAPGEKKRYGIGAALLAAQSGYPVVPVAHNAGLFWSRNAFIKQPGSIEVHIGPVIDPKDKSAEEINLLAATWIEETMMRLPKS